MAIFDEKLLGISQSQLIALFETAQTCSKSWPNALAQTAADLLDTLFETTRSNSLAVPYLQLGYLMQLMGMFLEELPQGSSSKPMLNHSEVKYKEDLVLLNKIFAYIETHFQEDITLETISDLVIQFLSDYRLDQARYILSQERLPMVDVADKAGFSSVKTFHHVFKKSQGISPLQYQKQLQAKR